MNRYPGPPGTTQTTTREGEQLEHDRAPLVMIQPAPYNAEAPHSALHVDTTSTDQHCVRSNFALPEHDGTVVVDGAVSREIRLDVDEIRALPTVERVVSLECAGNGRLRQTPLPTGEPWGCNAVSTARWTGARLVDVLRQAAPADDAVEVWSTARTTAPTYSTTTCPRPGSADLRRVGPGHRTGTAHHPRLRH